MGGAPAAHSRFQPNGGRGMKGGHAPGIHTHDTVLKKDFEPQILNPNI